jgi:hypothetical protein
VHVSTGNLLRQYIREHDLGDLSRKNINAMSTQLRREKGASFPIEIALATPGSRVVISGPRLPAEIKSVSEAGGVIVAVIAPLELRYQRAKERGRIDDNVTLDDFRAIEDKEASSDNPFAHNTNKTIEMANIVIENVGTLDELYKKADDIVVQLERT